MFVLQMRLNVLVLFFVCSFRDTHFSCPLIMMNHSYNCVCKDTTSEILPETRFTIEICYDTVCDPVSKTFYPFLYSKYELIIILCLWGSVWFSCVDMFVSVHVSLHEIASIQWHYIWGKKCISKVRCLYCVWEALNSKL